MTKFKLPGHNKQPFGNILAIVTTADNAYIELQKICHNNIPHRLEIAVYPFLESYLGPRGSEEQRLLGHRHRRDNLLDVILEAHVAHTIRLIQHQDARVVQGEDRRAIVTLKR